MKEYSFSIAQVCWIGGAVAITSIVATLGTSSLSKKQRRDKRRKGNRYKDIRRARENTKSSRPWYS